MRPMHQQCVVNEYVNVWQSSRWLMHQMVSVSLEAVGRRPCVGGVQGRKWSLGGQVTLLSAESIVVGSK